jgi:hypothetical protein
MENFQSFMDIKLQVSVREVFFFSFVIGQSHQQPENFFSILGLIA